MVMEVQEIKLEPLDNESPVNTGDYFIHIKSENLYKVIDSRDNIIKLNGKWCAGVIYTRADIQSEMYVRTLEDFRQHFSLAHSHVKDEILQI